jgi:hypothetical protein
VQMIALRVMSSIKMRFIPICRDEHISGQFRGLGLSQNPSADHWLRQNLTDKFAAKGFFNIINCYYPLAAEKQ